MSNESQLLQLKKTINDAKRERDRLQGEIKAVEKQIADLKKKVGKSQDLSRLKRQVESKRKRLETRIKKFKEDFDMEDE